MNKKRILPMVLAIIILGATILSFIVPILAYGDTVGISEKVECINVEVEKTNDRHKYDLTLTFEARPDGNLKPLQFKDVFPEFYTDPAPNPLPQERYPVQSFYSDRNKSTLSLNNSSEANSAFYSHNGLDIKHISPANQKGDNPYRFLVKIFEAEYDGEGSTMSVKADFNIKKPSGDDYFALSTGGYLKVSIPDEEVDHIIEDGTNPVEKPKSSTPYIIISDYKLSSDQLYAGDKFTLDLTMKNTNNRTDIENVIMKVTAADGFSILDSSNTFYFEKLPVGNNIIKSLNFMVLPTVETKVYPINISFTYEYVADNARTQGTCEEVINLSTNQKERFEISPVQTPPQIFPGEEFPLDIECVNKGKTQIYNVSATIKGNIDNPNQYEYVGNIQPGASNTISMFLSRSEPNTDIAGEILISYEDEIGNVKTKSVPFSTKTMELPDPGMDNLENGMGEMPPDGMGENPDDMEAKGLTKTQKVIIIVGGVLALAICYKAVKAHKEKKEFEDDDEIN